MCESSRKTEEPMTLIADEDITEITLWGDKSLESTHQMESIDMVGGVERRKTPRS